VPGLSGLVLYVQACDPMRRGTPALQLLVSRRSRTAPLPLEKIETPKPWRVDRPASVVNAPDMPTLKKDIVAL